jgi:hypothetical protein
MNTRHLPRPPIKKQRGLVAILVTVAFTLIVGFAALTIDVNHMVFNKAKLQNAVDSAALAGAMQADETDSASDVYLAVYDALNKYDDAAGNTSLKLTGSGAPSVVIQMANDAETFPGMGVNQANDIYVRVQVTAYPLERYFLGLFGINKEVTVSAVAGPGVGGGTVCEVVPLAVCSINDVDTHSNNGYGYSTGDAYALKLQKPSELMGAGNFQLLDVGSGASSVESALAGNFTTCINPGELTISEPGNTIGPVADGLNTRFDQYDGNMKGTETDNPSDIFVSELSDFNTVDYDDTRTYEDAVRIYDSSIKNPTESDPEAADPWGYDEYLAAEAACSGDSGGCRSDGVSERRMIKVAIIDCPENQKGGKGAYLVHSVGCFFLLNSASSTAGANTLPIIGEFREVCSVANTSPGGNGTSGITTGPYTVVLYKDPHNEES